MYICIYIYDIFTPYLIIYIIINYRVCMCIDPTMDVMMALVETIKRHPFIVNRRCQQCEPEILGVTSYERNTNIRSSSGTLFVDGRN